MLAFLVTLAAVLNALAVAWFCVLVGLRWVRGGAEARVARVRTALMQAFTAYAWGDGALGRDSERLVRTHPIVAARLLLTMADQIRGRDIDTLAAELARLGLVERLEPSLTRGPVKTRTAAAEAIILFGDEGVGRLHRAYERSKPPGRAPLALALAGTVQAPSPADLLSQFRRPGCFSPTLLKSALARTCSTQGTGPVLGLLDADDVEGEYRAAVLYAVKEYVTPSILPLLLRECTRPEPVVRVAALEMLGEVATADLLPLLTLLLQDPSPAVRSAAATACGSAGAAAAVGPLAGLLADPTWTVRSAAARALARAGGEGRHALESASAAISGSDAARFVLHGKGAA